MPLQRGTHELRATNALLFVLLFFGYNTMSASVFLGAIRSMLLVAAVLGLWLVLNDRLRKTISLVTLPSLTVFMFLVVTILLTMIVNNDDGHGNYLLALKLLFALVVISVIPFDRFRASFTNTMAFFAAYSLLATYILARSPVAAYVPRFENQSSLTFMNFGAGFVLDYPGYYRNFGIFTEPGVYACYLIPALAFAVSNTTEASISWLREAKIVVLAIALISTFSPVGIFAALFISLFHTLLNYQVPVRSRIVTLLLLFTTTALVLLSPDWAEGIRHSADKVFEQGNSYLGRTYVLRHNLDLWTHRPLLGHGLTNVIEGMNAQDLQIVANSNTSTTTLLLAVYGAPFALLATVPLYFTFKGANAIMSTAAFVGFLIAINSQSMFHSEFLWYLVFYGVSSVMTAEERHTTTNRLNSLKGPE